MLNWWSFFKKKKTCREEDNGSASHHKYPPIDHHPYGYGDTLWVLSTLSGKCVYCPERSQAAYLH